MPEIILKASKFKNETVSSVWQIAEPVLESGGWLALTAGGISLALGALYLSRQTLVNDNNLDASGTAFLAAMGFAYAARKACRPAIRRTKWAMNYLRASFPPTAPKRHFQTLAID